MQRDSRHGESFSRKDSVPKNVASHRTKRFASMRLAWRNVSPNPPKLFYRGASPKYHARHKLLTLQLDMADWFRPTWTNYSSRIGKADILAALREAKGATAPAWEKGQKGRPRRSRGAAYRRNGPAARAPARSRSRARDGFEGSDLKTRERPLPGGLSPARASSPFAGSSSTGESWPPRPPGPPAPPAAPPCRPVWYKCS